jgi:predicted nucleic acid-binding Zn ribbon protein
MPIYIYRCEECGEVVETMQKITESPYLRHKEIPITENVFKNCDGQVKRIPQTSTVIFKGKGWTPKKFKY